MSGGSIPKWAALWAFAGALLGVLSLTGGGVGHLAGWMAPVVLGVIMGGMGAVGGLLYRGASGLGNGLRAPRRALLGAVCGGLGVVVVGMLPAVGIALGWSWLLLLGVGLGAVSGLAITVS